MPFPPTHPLIQMFQVKTLNELHSPSEHELSICDRLLKDDFFPNSLWVMSLRACVLYHLHGSSPLPVNALSPPRSCHAPFQDYYQAEIQFEAILKLDPYRIDDIDIFSNILYVTENRLRLSRLAHEFLALDKDRPEVCCLVGSWIFGAEARSMLRNNFLQATTTRCVQSMKRPSSTFVGQLSSIGLTCRLGLWWAMSTSSWRTLTRLLRRTAEQ